MKTSYFANRKIGSEYRQVSIAVGTPRWFKGDRYQKLNPRWDMVQSFKETGDEQEYRIEYQKILDRLDAKQVYKELGENAVLLCWEKSGQFCHRRLVAEWIENSLGIEIPEL